METTFRKAIEPCLMDLLSCGYLPEAYLTAHSADMIHKGQGPGLVMSQPVWLGRREVFPFQEEALNDSY